MVDGDGELPGAGLRETAACVCVDAGGQLCHLLAGGIEPAGQPLRRQVGVGGPEPPGAGPDEHAMTQHAEALGGGRNGIRSQQPAARRHAPLVGVERARHVPIERLGDADADLAAEWLTGWLDAACEQQAELAAGVDGYAGRRLAQARAGQLAVTVDHADLLVLS